MNQTPVAFDAIIDWGESQILAVWPVFLKSCEAIVASQTPLRLGKQPEAAHKEVARRALALEATTENVISKFIRENFQPIIVQPEKRSGEEPGFVTGYYEPDIAASRIQTSEFSAPILARPDDLVDMRGVSAPGWDSRYESAQKGANGLLGPYPTRSEIEAGAIADHTRPLAWLRDAVEVFLVQVQGSARLTFVDGARARLVYAGRNGRPYTSIGRILVKRGAIPIDEMSLARLKQWVRNNGQSAGDAGLAVMHSNESYVFFQLNDVADENIGPIGAQGVALTPMRSLAVDRSIWPYGLMFLVRADLPSLNMGFNGPGQLMVAQDTGSAIVGPARGDLFIGTGEKAGEIAGNIRHSADFIAFLPQPS